MIERDFSRSERHHLIPVSPIGWGDAQWLLNCHIFGLCFGAATVRWGIARRGGRIHRASTCRTLAGDLSEFEARAVPVGL